MNLSQLQTLAEDASAAARDDLFEQVAALIAGEAGEAPAAPAALALAGQILVSLVRQVEADVRKRVACRLAALDHSPADVIRALARDEIEVAAPVLLQSPVLSTQDLLDVVAARSTAHREVIARRSCVPPDVVAALVALKEPQVIQTLLANAGASIPRPVFGDLIALAQSVEAIRRPLIQRNDAPADLMHRLFWHVSAALRQAILQRFVIDVGDLDAAIADMLDEQKAGLAPATRSASTWVQGEVQALVARARSGDMTGFTTALATVIGVDEATARRIVADTGGEPLAIACKAMGADRSQFTSILMQVDRAVLGQLRPLSFLEGLARIYDRLPAARARTLLQVWCLQDARAAA